MKQPDGPQFYGRRKGRPLRAHLQSLMQTSLDKVRLHLDDADHLAKPASLFPHHPETLYLEIGFGGGEHLAQLAKANPVAGFIGAEPFVNGVASLLRHIDDAGLENIRIWPDDVRLILDALPAGALSGAYIMFPDPWPKRRHASRRILNQTMLDALARLIRPGGHLRMASDHPEAKIWLLAEAMAHDAFLWNATQPADWRARPADWPQTRYMAKGVREGRPSSWFAFQRL